MALIDYRIELRNAASQRTHLFGPRSIIPSASPAQGAPPSMIQWDYNRIGGCGQADFTLVAPFETFSAQSLEDLDCRILLDFGGGLEIWWRGYIEEIRLEKGEPDIAQITAMGWSKRLEKLSVIGLGFTQSDAATIFTSTDIAGIARQLIDHASPFTPIFYDAISAPATSGFVPSEISFNSSIFAALTTLGQSAANIEWGVDRNAKFHFRVPVSDIRHVAIVGRHLKSFNLSSSSRNLINRLYVFGGNGYQVLIENLTSLSDDQSQSTVTSWQPIGKATGGQQETLQTFQTLKGTVSEVEVKIRDTGFTTTNLVTDGNMENAGVTFWPVVKARTIRAKSVIKHGGAQGLEVNHNESGVGYYGVYQDVTVTAGVEYRVEAWQTGTIWEESGAVFDAVDGTALPVGGGTVLGTQKYRGFVWQKTSFNVTPTTTTLGLRFYAYNADENSGLDWFWIDDVTVRPVSNCQLDLVEWDAGALVVKNILSSASIPFDNILGAASQIVKVRVSGYLSLGTNYGIRIKRQGLLSDTRYFEVAYNSAGGYGSGAFYRWDGAAWQSVAGDQYFVTRMPTSQYLHGVKSDVIVNPSISNDSIASLWGGSVLASLGVVQKRAQIDLVNWEEMIERNVPLGLLSVRGEYSAGLKPERISYSITTEGLSVSVDLGQVLPRLADILAWLELSIARSGVR